MAKVKVDMSGQDPKESKGFLPIPEGVHRMKVLSLDPGYAKNDDRSEDKSRPKLTAVLQDTERRYGQVWLHLSFSDKDYPRQKMDQFLMAVGILSDKKRKAEFDTNDAIGKVLDVQIVAEQNRERYTPKVLNVWPQGESGSTTGAPNFDFDDGELDTEFNTKDFDMTPDDEEEMDDGLFTKDDLQSKDAAELRKILKEDYEENTRVRDKDKLIEMILKFQAEYCEAEGIEDPAAEEGDLEEDDEEILEDDEEILEDDEDESEYLTEDQLKAMSVADLKSTAADFDVTVKGKTRSAIVKEILEAQAAPGDEEPF